MPSSKFEDGVALYVFDKKLRLLVLDAIERLEIAFRVDIAYVLGKQDPFAYTNPSLLHGNFTKKINPKTGKTSYQEWLNKHEQLINRSREDFAEHYKTKYGLPLPIWIAVELWDFGLLATFFQGMTVQHKTEIAAKYNIPDWQVMESWLRCLNYIRDVVSHHSRLWNRNLIDQPKLAKKGAMQHFDFAANNVQITSRLYIILCILSHFMKLISPRSSWQKRITDLLKSFPTTPYANINDMGFPPNWEQQYFWKIEENKSKTCEKHIVACIDLLGFEKALRSNENDEKIEKILDYFKKCVRSEKVNQYQNGGTDHCIIEPRMRAISDQIVISVSAENVKPPFDNAAAINQIIFSGAYIAIATLMHGFLSRGGIIDGELYTFNRLELEFDLAYAKATKLERDANFPIIIIPQHLALQSSEPFSSFLQKITIKDKSFSWIDFFKFAFTSNYYAPNEIPKLISHVNLLIEENLKMNGKDEKVHNKWLWFQNYFETSKETYYQKQEISIKDEELI